MAVYVVTGGSGFCGVEIVRLLSEKGHKVRVVDLEEFPEKLNNVTFHKIDIRSKLGMRSVCKGADYIIHTAAKVPISKAGKEFESVNVFGTKNVLETALELKIKKVVHISSSAVQMSKINPVKEFFPFNPVGIYAKSKMHAELVCQSYLKKGLNIDIVRPRTVIGLGRLGIFDILFDWISNNKNIYIIGSGKNKIQFLYSKDLANLCYLSSKKKGSYIFNVGSKNFGTLREDLEYLIKHAKKNSKVVSLPVKPTIVTLAALDKVRLSPLASWHYLTYHKDFYFDNLHPYEVLGWKPTYGNKEILKIAYDNYIKNKDSILKIKKGTSHRKTLKQGILGIIKRLS